MNFSIIATSDIHGHAERFSQLAQQIAAEKPDILLDLGDLLQGSHLSYYYEEQNTRHPILNLVNTLGYDAAVFGNHEFNYSQDDIQTMRAACDFPWLACNVGDFAEPYIIKNVQGLRIAIIGVVTHFVPHWDEWYSTDSICFQEAFERARDIVQYVHTYEQPNFVILCYHGGFERDPQTGQPFCLDDGENEAYKMLTEIDGVHILLTGHQHLELAMTINGVTLAQPGSNAQCFAKINVTYDEGQFQHHAQLIHVKKDLAVQPFPHYHAWINTVLATLQTSYTYAHFFEPRLQSHRYTDLIHQMQRQVTGATISVVELPYHSSGGFSDTVTIRDVLYNFPRKNFLKVITLTGAEIKEALELCAAVFALTDKGDIDFSSVVHYPEPQPFIYDVWGGIDYELNVSKPVGQRVTKLLYNGQAIDLSAHYEVAVSSYRATGAHSFTMMKKPAIREIRTDIPKLMMDFLKQMPKITAAGQFSVIATK